MTGIVSGTARAPTPLLVIGERDESIRAACALLLARFSGAARLEIVTPAALARATALAAGWLEHHLA